MESFDYTAAVAFFILAALLMVFGMMAMDLFSNYLSKKDYNKEENGGDDDNNRS